ncbi:ATP-binding protein [Steroidobacter flavus]|uniref:ATP-binding protein n=1 Tax=Steroidobacter flavus TaxID=1842136 RepID=A0ABV8SQY4_9GAMM
MLGVWRSVSCTLVLFLFSLTCSALDRNRSLQQFHHTSWTINEGAPGQISALAQTDDGYLWLAAPDALYRFDGVRFEAIPDDVIPQTTIQSLFAANGGLWVGYQKNGVSFLKDGRARHYDQQDGLPFGTAMGLQADAEGTLWVTTSTGLARFDGKRWHKVTLDPAQPEAETRAVFLDRDGTLWVAMKDRVFYLWAGSHAFEETGERIGFAGRFAQAPDGRVWVAEADGAIHPLRRPGEKSAPATRIEIQSAGILFDRDGVLWMSGLGSGMHRQSRAGAPIETFTRRDGLSADYAWPLFEDREGNIWAGTSGGLDRFRYSALIQAPFPDGAHDFALVPGEHGEVWAGTTTHRLMRLRGEEVSEHGPQLRVTATNRDRRGTLWFGGPQGIWRVIDGEPKLVSPLPSSVVVDDVQALAVDDAGVVWAAIQGVGGLWKYENNRWTNLPNAPGVEARRAPRTLLTDSHRQLWIAYANNALVRSDASGMHLYSQNEGLSLGDVLALFEGRHGLWAAGEKGLQLLHSDRFQSVSATDPKALHGISGVVETAEGDLWLHTMGGILHIAAAELDRAVQDPKYAVSFDRFDYLDGLVGRPTLLRPLPTMIQGDDGRLWFATDDGVVWIDPRHIVRNSQVPRIAITSLNIKGVAQPLKPGIQLPVGTRSLEIDFAVLSLSIPERAHARYQLEGMDDSWRDAGSRRQAGFTNLGPGGYRFRVVGSNNDGVWNEEGASLEFSILPAFYQTHWFRILAIAVALMLLAGLYQLRMRQVSKQMHDRLAERIAERERIARELHDTLLQGFQGLILRFQSVVDRIPTQEPARQMMESALERADQVLVDGRDRVRDLRSSEATESDLAEAFKQVAQEVAAESATIDLQIVEIGTARPLHPIVRDEAYWIGREALLNALRHAQAKAVEVEVQYEPRELRINVRDDGRGIPDDVLESGGRDGRWGLTGMRERARKIHGRVEIWSRSDAGTEVQLRVPGAIAYDQAARRTSWFQRISSLYR